MKSEKNECTQNKTKRKTNRKNKEECLWRERDRDRAYDNQIHDKR